MTCSQELENIDQFLTHRVDTLSPGQTLPRLRGEGLPQRRLRPENLSGVSPGDRRLRLGDRPHHATLGLVEHEAVVVNIELVVTNDTLLVRSFLLNLNKNGLIVISSDPNTHKSHVFEELCSLLSGFSGQIFRDVNVGGFQQFCLA